MTRRARTGPIATLGRGVERMAPGGRGSASESPVRPFWRPIGEAGEEPAAAPTCIDPAHEFAWNGEWTSGVPEPTKYMYYVYDYDYPGVPDPPLCCGIPPYGWNPPPPPPAGTTRVTLTITVYSNTYMFAGSSFGISCKPGHAQTVSGGPWSGGDVIEVDIPMDWEFLRLPGGGFYNAPVWPVGALLICPAPDVGVTLRRRPQ